MTKEQAVGQAITRSLIDGEPVKVMYCQDDYEVMSLYDRRYEEHGYDCLGVYEAELYESGALSVINQK